MIIYLYICVCVCLSVCFFLNLHLFSRLPARPGHLPHPVGLAPGSGRKNRDVVIVGYHWFAKFHSNP